MVKNLVISFYLVFIFRYVFNLQIKFVVSNNLSYNDDCDIKNYREFLMVDINFFDKCKKLILKRISEICLCILMATIFPIIQH